MIHRSQCAIVGRKYVPPSLLQDGNHLCRVRWHPLLHTSKVGFQSLINPFAHLGIGKAGKHSVGVVDRKRFEGTQSFAQCIRNLPGVFWRNNSRSVYAILPPLSEIDETMTSIYFPSFDLIISIRILLNQVREPVRQDLHM